MGWTVAPVAAPCAAPRALSRTGTLFRYGPGASHTAFKTGNAQRHLVLVGGLTDGLLFSQYVAPLAAAVEELGWSLVQPLLSSSYGGWGLGSLDADAAELLRLAHCLKDNHHSQGIVLMGHSTGCQDAIRYTEKCKDADAAPLLGVILQAPVSDREWLATDPRTEERLAEAQRMVAEGRGEDVLFRDTDANGANVAVCARRFLSLAGRGGDDDMFSTDFTDEELEARLKPLQGVKTLLLMSCKDEYVPDQAKYLGLGARMAVAIGTNIHAAYLQNANHALSAPEDQKEAIDCIVDYLRNTNDYVLSKMC